MINLRNYTKLLQTIGDSDEQYIVICDKDGKKVDYHILTDVSKTEEYYFYIDKPYFQNKEKPLFLAVCTMVRLFLTDSRNQAK